MLIGSGKHSEVLKPWCSLLQLKVHTVCSLGELLDSLLMPVFNIAASASNVLAKRLSYPGG